MSDTHEYTEMNRRAWDEIAAVRAEKWPDAAFFVAGGSLLDPVVLAAAGDVTGHSLLHLQCATGEETLSWAVAGASATGVDISEPQIALARVKATAAGCDVAFVAADVYALPPDLARASFDWSTPVAGQSSGCPILPAGRRLSRRCSVPAGGSCCTRSIRSRDVSG